MRHVLRVFGLALLPGAFFVTAGLVIWRFMALRAAIATGRPAFDQFQSRIAVAVLWYFMPDSLSPARATAIGRAVMALLHNENGDGWDGKSIQVGDRDLSAGPSVGPLQVYRATAIALGLVPPTETAEGYATRAADLDWCVEAGVRVFREKLEIAGGNIPYAIRLYNGSGDKAESYMRNALTWLDSQYGDNALGPPPAALA